MFLYKVYIQFGYLRHLGGFLHFEAFGERYFGYIGVVFIILEVLGVSWRLEDILVILQFVGGIFGDFRGYFSHF